MPSEGYLAENIITKEHGVTGVIHTNETNASLESMFEILKSSEYKPTAIDFVQRVFQDKKYNFDELFNVLQKLKTTGINPNFEHTIILSLLKRTDAPKDFKTSAGEFLLESKKEKEE